MLIYNFTTVYSKSKFWIYLYKELSHYIFNFQKFNIDPRFYIIDFNKQYNILKDEFTQLDQLISRSL